MSFSNTFDTTNQGSAVSNREDLTDVLTILAPEETPILSSASKQKASATFVEWTIDKLSAPNAAGISEGADVTTFTDQFAGRAKVGLIDVHANIHHVSFLHQQLFFHINSFVCFLIFKG